MGFILAFIQRVLSGIVSYYGYSKNRIGLIFSTIVMFVYPLLSSKEHWIYMAFVIVNIIVVGMKMISFSDDMLPFLKKYKDIHFWENLVTGGYTLFLVLMGYNILLIICSVYPALILHKG